MRHDDRLDIYGRGVNLAARIAGLAHPGECVVTTPVREQIVPGLDAEIVDLAAGGALRGENRRFAI